MIFDLSIRLKNYPTENILHGIYLYSANLKPDLITYQNAEINYNQFQVKSHLLINFS